LAGDELLPEATALTTHAITIAAPPAAVWPWLAQMGWGRAGWYTYRWVDRLLFPANGPSANQLLPEHQQLEVGDRVLDGPPEADCWFTVEQLEPDRLLVLRSTRHLPASWRQRGLGMDWIWSWQLSQPDPGRTRLIQRNRMRLDPAWFERAFLATIIRPTSSWPAATCAACSAGWKPPRCSRSLPSLQSFRHRRCRADATPQRPTVPGAAGLQALAGPAGRRDPGHRATVDQGRRPCFPSWCGGPGPPS
jgi:hypothetical protein